MSCDCLSKYHGQASRDARRVWSGWAFTVIHGQRYEPDYVPRYEPDYGPRFAPEPGRAARRAAGRAARRTSYSTSAPLDLRTNGRTTPIHTNGHQGLESTAGFMYRTLGLRSGVGLGHAGVYYTPLDRVATHAGRLYEECVLD